MEFAVRQHRSPTLNAFVFLNSLAPNVRVWCAVPTKMSRFALTLKPMVTVLIHILRAFARNHAVYAKT